MAGPSTPETARELALPPGWRLFSLEETDSTSTEARRRLQAGEGAEGLVITAQRQTAGRGRRGRTWESPPGNLFVSITLAQGETVAATAQLSFVAALAVIESLQQVAPHIAFHLKWPNDVLAGPEGAKVCGLLLETEGPWVILGIGLNVVAAPPPGTTPYPATSLRAEGAPHLSARDCLGPLCHHLAALVGLWRRAGFEPIRQGWLAHAKGLNHPLTAHLHEGQSLDGVFHGLDTDGALMLRLPSGTVQRVLAGDIFFPPRLS